jgi:hypothetical protein
MKFMSSVTRALGFIQKRQGSFAATTATGLMTALLSF